MDKKFKIIAKIQQKNIDDFEKLGKQIIDIHEMDSDLHTMIVKGKLFENLSLDEQFENVDLLDYLGYERIISCNKNKI